MPTTRSTRRPSPVRSLILLNAGLLVVLAGVSFVPQADAQQSRVRGKYTMLSSRVQGSTPDGVILVDTSNMELIASTWDASRRTLNFIGFRDMRVDAANSQSRPR